MAECHVFYARLFGPANGIDAKLCGHGPRAEAVAARRLLAARRE